MRVQKGNSYNFCRLLIAEAEKAANALEAAAKKSPLAQASLIETRRLIAEAIQSISSIDEGQEDSRNDASISLASPKSVSCTELEMSAELDDPNQTVERKVNGSHALEPSNCVNMGLGCEKSGFEELGDASGNSVNILGFNFERPGGVQDSVDGAELAGSSRFCSHNVVNGKEVLPRRSCTDANLGARLLDASVKLRSFTERLGESRLNGSMEHERKSQLNGMTLQQEARKEEKPPKIGNVMKKKKKWVRGRLVEVDEGK